MNKKILFLILIGTAFLVFVFGVRIYRFSSKNNAMADTFANRDLLLANRFIYFISSPQRSDIVVFAHPEMLSNNPVLRLLQTNVYGSRDMVSRVVAIPGDSIKGVVEDNAFVLYLKKPNENKFNRLNEPYIKQEKLISMPTPFEVQLKPNEYWVMSDNRQVALRDSRHFGPIPRQLITGKIAFKLN